MALNVSTYGQAQIATVSVTPGSLGQQIPRDFVGFNVEHDHAGFLGTIAYPNTVFYQFMKNLGPSVLRIGGISTETFCWPSPPIPEFCRSILRASDIANYFNASTQTNWKVLLNINLSQDSGSWALGEVLNGVVPNSQLSQVLALEIGNEPDLYPLFNFRPRTYSPARHVNDFNGYVSAFKGNPRAAVYPLAGPVVAFPWRNATDIGTFIEGVGAENLATTTVHNYPLNGANITVPQLLAPTTVSQLATDAPSWIGAATSRGLDMRLAETNSNSPFGVAGVTDVFAQTLWTVDYTFTAANAGFRGINYHNAVAPGLAYSYVTTTVTQNGSQLTYANQVKPMYYGMYLFAHEAQGQYLVPATINTSNNVVVWATSACSACAVKLFVLNKDMSTSGTVNVNLATPMGHANLMKLSAPTVTSTEASITYGGAQFDNNTGLLGATQVTPVVASGSSYSFNLRNAAIALLTINGVSPDATVRDGIYANNNYGSIPILFVQQGPTGTNLRSFLKFDLTGVSSVGSAQLQLYGRLAASSGTQAVNVYGVSDTTWTESILTWNNQPAPGFLLGTLNVGTTAQSWTLDLTPYVQSRKALGATALSIQLQSGGGSGLVVFNAREAPSDPPLLVVAP